MALLLYSFGLNARRYFLLFLIIGFLIASGSVSEPVFLGLFTVALLFALLLMLDYMFLNEKAFKFEPDYKNWKRQEDKGM